MTMISTRGAMNLAAVAEGLQVSPSNASRICDRLIKAGMIDRRDDPTDRRNLVLTLTKAGQTLIDRVIAHRRNAIRRILRKIPDEQRDRLAGVLDDFATAAGEPVEVHRHSII
jgi:DNA-binding MarR family transcriptional regulator